MSIILPAAPANFYTPTLNTLKDDVSAVNGQTTGQVTILTAAPDDINSAWSEAGAGNPDLDEDRGSLVVGQAPIGIIVGPSASYLEGTSEYGYKLEFSKVINITIKLASGVGSALLVGFGVIVGRDFFNDGSNNDLRYIGKIEDLIITDPVTGLNRERRAVGIQNISVSDGDIIELPAWELIVNYAEPIT